MPHNTCSRCGKSVGPRDRQQTGMIDCCEGCYKKALAEPDVVKPRRKA